MKNFTTKTKKLATYETKNFEKNNQKFQPKKIPKIFCNYYMVKSNKYYK